MAISNEIGSNIFNLLVVSGVCALFQPLVIKKENIKERIPIFVLYSDYWRDGTAGMMVGHMDGIILVVIFALFLYWMVRSAKKSMQAEKMLKQRNQWTCQSGNVLVVYLVAAWLLL